MKMQVKNIFAIKESQYTFINFSLFKMFIKKIVLKGFFFFRKEKASSSSSNTNDNEGVIFAAHHF